MTDPRITILASLRAGIDETKAQAAGKGTPTEYLVSGYTAAVIHTCYAIEATCTPHELWSTGVLAADLTDKHPIGEHLAATRRQFHLIG
ncbi:MAG: hypothetical protein J0L73_26435 [Verrucomicrobia bacterium]|nr:hypothetical protein [Verrucomicrobiota bacterium]